MLTQAQKNFIRERYKALEPGDEPPYPLKGTREVLTAVSRINGEALTEGNLSIAVLVGADGKAKSAKVIEKPTRSGSAKIDTMVKYVVAVIMLDNYKPAICRGKPCEMFYPMSYRLGGD